MNWGDDSVGFLRSVGEGEELKVPELVSSGKAREVESRDGTT